MRYRALRGACSGDYGSHRLNKNSIQRSSPTKSCVVYRLVGSIGGFGNVNDAKSNFFFWSMLSVHVIFTDLYTLKICTEHGALLTARSESFLLKPSHSSLSSQSLFFPSLRSCHRCIFCDVAHDAAEVSSESSIDLAATRTCIHRYLPASSIT